ncbi:hypothetical protein Taro_014854 [Colocasia esculenta]|uniref:Uncharacterized protein n=1 Tax=Colocasia esculenta TaxID=4460 RepID=A0A843UN32_COLES|nr:hypothetical protein [Colocasia esculenta]
MTHKSWKHHIVTARFTQEPHCPITTTNHKNYITTMCTTQHLCKQHVQRMDSTLQERYRCQRTTYTT